MEELKDLIKVSLSGRISGIETFNQFTANKKSLTYKLFHHISEGKINTDAEAKALLYGEQYKGFKYNMLKERFREKLYTNVLFVQPRKRDTRSYAHNAYYCHKYYIVAKLLLMIVAKSAGRSLMRKVLNRAQTYQVYDIALLAASALRREALTQGNPKDFTLYSALFKKLLAIVEAENEAEEKHDSLMMHFTTSYSAKPELIAQANETCTYIAKLKNTYNTYYLNQAYFQAQILQYDLLNDYTATLNACNAFETYLLSQPNFYSSVRHGNLIILKLNSYLYLQHYTEGLELAKKSANFYEAAEGNWLALKEMHFLLALRAKNYIEAAEVYKLVFNYFRSRNIDERKKEIWRIFSGYLWLCLTTKGMIKERNETFSYAKDFKIAKLLNEVPIYTKDKQGVNLSLGILQFVLFIQHQEFGRAIEKVEQLKIYIHKYISRKNSARDHIMLKLILLLTQNNFNYNIIIKKDTALLKKLQSLANIENAYSRTHIEVLPYEMLWNIIYDILITHKIL